MTRAGQDVHVFSLKRTSALRSHTVWSDPRDCMKCPWIVIVDMPHGQHAARPPDRRGKNTVARLLERLLSSQSPTRPSLPCTPALAFAIRWLVGP